jgi:hypothetical protein
MAYKIVGRIARCCVSRRDKYALVPALADETAFFMRNTVFFMDTILKNQRQAEIS